MTPRYEHPLADKHRALTNHDNLAKAVLVSQVHVQERAGDEALVNIVSR